MYKRRKQMKRYWKDKRLLTIISAMSLGLGTSTALAACISGDCTSLGYTKSAADCNGLASVRCPFDTSKYFCVQSDSVCDFTATKENCSAQCRDVDTAGNACTRNGMIYYEDCAWDTYCQYSKCVNGSCKCDYTKIEFVKENIFNNSGSLPLNLLGTRLGGGFIYQNNFNGTSPITSIDRNKGVVSLDCDGIVPGTNQTMTLDQCSTKRFTIRPQFNCEYKVTDSSGRTETKIITYNMSDCNDFKLDYDELTKFNSTNVQNWCKKLIRQDRNGCYKVSATRDEFFSGTEVGLNVSTYADQEDFCLLFSDLVETKPEDEDCTITAQAANVNNCESGSYVGSTGRCGNLNPKINCTYILTYNKTGEKTRLQTTFTAVGCYNLCNGGQTCQGLADNICHSVIPTNKACHLNFDTLARDGGAMCNFVTIDSQGQTTY